MKLKSPKNETEHAISLQALLVGPVANIVALEGDLDMKLRLVNLGFHRHGEIRIVMKCGEQFVVVVDGSRFAMGADIAGFIKVRVVGQ